MNEEGVSEEGDDPPSGGWQRVHPLAIAVAALRGFQNALLPMAAILFSTDALDGGIALAVLVALGIVLITALIAWLSWIRLRYRIGSNDVTVEQGLVSRSARSVPYERIQDISLEQSLIPRLLGLVEVRFETGAGGQDELKLAYVSSAQGERLREVVRDLRSEATGAVAREEPAPDRGRPLFTMGPRRLLLFGTFEFSLVVFAVLGGLAQQFEFLLPFELWDLDQWEQRLSGPGAWLAGLGWASRFAGLVLAVVALALIGLATGVIRTFLRDYGFVLEQTAKGFRRRRGLLTRTDVVMPVQRVQAIIVSTGLVRRIWGWYGLSFVSLAQDARSANHAVAPFARLEEIAPIVEASGFVLPGSDVDWRRRSTRHRFDRALLGAALPAIFGLLALFLLDPAWLGLGLVLLAGFILVREHFLWRHERYAVDPSQILARRGWLAPRLKIADRVKLHSVEVAQGPMARRHGYADLRFGLAGGSLTFNGLRLQDAEEMRDAVLGSIAEIDFSRLSR